MLLLFVSDAKLVIISECTIGFIKKVQINYFNNVTFLKRYDCTAPNESQYHIFYIVP